MAEVVFSVSQINEYLNRKLWRDPFLCNVAVVGEVTNFTLSSTGHAFFSLKDEESILNCVIHDFISKEERNNIEDGALVKVTGKIVFYRKSGAVQLIVEAAIAQGVGDLFAQFEHTKKKLYDEGIFDISHKKALPEFPMSLGLVTSSAGAVLHDIVVVATRRFEGIKIIVYPVQVQGQGAPRQICEGIRYFNEVKNVDVIIVGRGGGSFEDLFAFNEEVVARAVYGSDIPLVSAVGHETDYTLCDMAADLRAPTPSAAAEMVVKDKQAIIDYLQGAKEQINISVLSLVNEYKNQTGLLMNSINAYPFELKTVQTRDRIISGRGLMKSAVFGIIEKYSLVLDKYKNNLEGLNPRNILKRGYAIIYDQNNNVIKSRKNAAADMDIEFIDGRVAVTRKG